MHFFLHGGMTSRDTGWNQRFYQAICALGNTVLIFPFGWEDEAAWYEKYKHNFIKNVPDKELSFVRASRDISTLTNQIKDADVLFFGWWVAAKHLEITNQIQDFKHLIKDKIIAWPSAWAVMRSKAYYRSREEEIKEWNDFLHIKMMVHRWVNRHSWLSDEERLQLLEAYGEKLPVYKIPEWEYIEFTL
jgi:hypothetical protein